jgi:serine proteinase stubble
LVIPKIRVRIGEWDFASTSEPQASIELKVVEKIVHPKYNFFTYEYDLALVKLEQRVEFRENIIPICLPGNDDHLVGEM